MQINSSARFGGLNTSSNFFCELSSRLGSLLKMNSQTASQTILELIALVENGEIAKALLILDAEGDSKVEEFLEPCGSLQITLVQLAAWRGSLQILKRLDAHGADLNSTDKLGRCALHHAAYEGHTDVVQWLLERGAAVESRFGITFRPKNEPYSVVTTTAANYEIGKNLPLPGCWGRTALHQAVEAKHVDVTKLLVEAGADVDACDERFITPLLLAASNVDAKDMEMTLRYEKVVDILVSAFASVNFACRYTGITALHDAVRLRNHGATERLLKGGACPAARLLITGITPLHIAVSTGCHQILDVLLTYVNSTTIDVQDETGKTALHEAIYQGHLRCIRALVDCGGNLAAEEDCGETAIGAVFGHVPNPVAFLTDILDARVHATDNTTSQVILDFRVLAPQGKLQMAVVSALIRAVQGMEQMTVLQHPLVEAFLGLKWFHLRRFFFILVVVYVFFLISLSAHSILLLYDHNNLFSRRILILSSCILICHNMLQLLLMPRHYARQFETWISMISVTISVVVGIADEVTAESASVWILRSISVGILFAWIEMMLLVARFPTWGYYALMFSTVLKNVLKVLLAFVWLIVGFALSFAILFHNKNQFHDPWKAIVKTLVMMTGEFEYGELFASTPKKNSSIDNSADSDENKTTFLSFLTGIVFLMFVMLASIVLMNLMIGLAVSDIQGLLNVGHIRRLMKQAEFVAHLERLTSHRIFHSRLIPRRLKEMLESKNKISTRLTLEKPTEYESGVHGISGKLVEVLFDLASANWDFDKEFQMESPNAEGKDCSLSETIYYLQERIKELQREKLRKRRMHSLKRKGGRRQKSTQLSS